MRLERKRLGIFCCLSLLGFQFLLTSSVNAQASQQNPKELTKQGFAYIRAGNWEMAQAAFETALRVTPKNTLVLYGSSLASFNLKKYTESAARLEIAVEILSTSNENNQLLADSLVLSAIISAVQNENARAISKLEKAKRATKCNCKADKCSCLKAFMDSTRASCPRVWRAALSRYTSPR